jgi:hypothetical protein
MELRLTFEAEPMTLSIEEFKELIRAGKVGSKSLYREFWTNGDWRAVDTLPLFQRMAAPDYSYEAELQQERKFFAQREKEKEMDALVSPLVESRHSEYQTGELIERCYGLSALFEAASEPDTVGVARFLVLPSFKPELVVTFHFKTSFLHVEARVSDTSVSHLLSNAVDHAYKTGDQQQLREFCYNSKLTRTEGRLRYQDAPEPFGSWLAFTRRALELESCSSLALDGSSYLQRVLHAGEVHTVEWSNPEEISWPKQTKMVKTYFNCLTAAGL